MYFKDVDIPDELLKAQADNKLVIFAGAGVSMASPTNLPSFKGLVKEVAKNTSFQDREFEIFDKALGDMTRKGIEVKKIANGILSDPLRKPNRLHESILKLFQGGIGQVRLVTTNQDPHFTTTAKKMFSDIDEYFAPALPLGSNFHGIVYLHGSTKRPIEHFVLTDGDFGKAYLVDGWATRFIKDLFLSDYTVLFVGYSHNDTVMSYLARGLPPFTKNKRFALTDLENEHWESLGIKPVTYPKLENTDDPHSRLGESLGDWAYHTSIGLLDHEQRIADMVGLPPPIGKNDIDYLVNRINDSDCTQFFTKHAKDPSWIVWLDEQLLLNDLFKPASEITPTAHHLGFWLAQTFIPTNPYSFLHLLEKYKLRIHENFWEQIAMSLNRSKRDGKISGEVFSIFVNILLRKPHLKRGMDTLEYLLEDCNEPDDIEAALALLDVLLQPKLKLQKRAYFPKEDTPSEKERLDAEVEIDGTTHWLQKAWDKLFRKNLDKYGERLYFLLRNKVYSSYSLLRPFESKDFDSISYQRNAVGRDSQNHSFDDGLQFILDAFSDVLAWASTKNKAIAETSIAWICADDQLLKRMAAYVVNKTTFMTTKEKFEWLLKTNFLYDYHTHHEVFMLLNTIYPLLDSKDKERLIDELVSKAPNDTKIEAKWKDYSLFSALSWLKSADSKCKIVEKSLREVLKKNPEYKQTDHPEHHSYTGGSWVRKSESPFSPDDLVNLDLNANIKSLLEWESKDLFGNDRSGLLSAIETANEKDPEFGHRLASVLIKNKNFETDLWDGLLRAWNKAELHPEAWSRILELPLNHKGLLKFRKQWSSILRDSVVRKEKVLPEKSYEQALTLASEIWQLPEDDEEGGKDVKDWLSFSINHYAGNLSEFWMRMIYLLNKEGERSIPEVIKTQLENSIEGKDLKSQLARVIIASQLHYLFTLDKDWTKKNVIPLFDLKSDQLKAKQAWDGYLAWGKWSDDLLDIFLPKFTQAFENLNFFEDNRERFIEHLSAISLYYSSSIKLNWVFDFLNKSNEEDRDHYSSKMAWQFRQMKSDARLNVWEKWLGEYYQNRVDGKPFPLDDLEKKVLIEIAIKLDDKFVDALDFILKMPAPNLEKTMTFHTLNEDKISQKYPREVLQLLLHILPPQSPIYVCYYIEPIAEDLIIELGKEEKFKADLLKLCDILAKLKCEKSSDLRKIIE